VSAAENDSELISSVLTATPRLTRSSKDEATNNIGYSETQVVAYPILMGSNPLQPSVYLASTVTVPNMDQDTGLFEDSSDTTSTAVNPSQDNKLFATVCDSEAEVDSLQYLPRRQLPTR
jgi:hypothetical protein